MDNLTALCGLTVCVDQGIPGPQGPPGGGTPFKIMADVTGATVAADQDMVIVARRDASSVVSPYVMRNAGLTAPSHSLKAKLADNRWFEYAPSKVIDMTNIGATESRTGAENTAFFQEALAYSLLHKNVPIYWPAGTFQHAGMVQLNTAVPIIGAGQKSTIMQLATGANAAGVGWTGTTTSLSGAVLCGMRLECNSAGQVNGHGIRIDWVDNLLIRDVTVFDTKDYGIGMESSFDTPYSKAFRNFTLDNVRIIEAGADGIDIKNPDNGNMGMKLSNITIESFNMKSQAFEAGIDVRGHALLENIVVYGPFRTGFALDGSPDTEPSMGIRFRGGDSPDNHFGGQRSSLNNFYIYNPDQTTTGYGVMNQHRYVNISNGVIIGSVTGLYVTPGSSFASVSNVQCIGQGDTGLAVLAAEGRYFGVRVTEAGQQSFEMGEFACGNSFFGCTGWRSDNGRNLTVSAPNDVNLCSFYDNITLSGEQVIDGVMTNLSKVLVMRQTNPAQNGIYRSGTGTWARDPSADAINEFYGYACHVGGGDTVTDRWFRCTLLLDTTLSIGTVPIYFTECTHNQWYGGTMTQDIPQRNVMHEVGGYRTQARGVLVLPSTEDNTQGRHHLIHPPTHMVITPMQDPGAANKWWVEDIGDNYFTIRSDVAPGRNVEFAWVAITGEELEM